MALRNSSIFQVFWTSCSFLLGYMLEKAFKDEHYVQLCGFPHTWSMYWYQVLYYFQAFYFSDIGESDPFAKIMQWIHLWHVFYAWNQVWEWYLVNIKRRKSEPVIGIAKLKRCKQKTVYSIAIPSQYNVWISKVSGNCHFWVSNIPRYFYFALSLIGEPWIVSCSDNHGWDHCQVTRKLCKIGEEWLLELWRNGPFWMQIIMFIKIHIDAVEMKGGKCHLRPFNTFLFSESWYHFASMFKI